MALEDRILSSLDIALGELTARLDQDVRARVRQDTMAEAAADPQRHIEEAEARVRATIDDAVNDARADERTRAAMEVRQLVRAETDQQIELLARHAARCLEALSVQKAVSPPSPRFWVAGVRP